MYLRLLYFYLQRLREYWFQVLAVWVRMCVQLVVLLLFWSTAASSSSSLGSTRSLFAYFLIATAINELVMIMNLRYAGTLMDRIKAGTISQVFLRPVRAAPYLYAETVGDNLVATTFLLPALVVGLVLEPPTLLGLVLFPLALVAALLLSFAMNLLIGCISFVSVEAEMLRWVANFPIQLASGAVIPLALFPDAWRAVLLLSPFPGLVAGPTLALRATELTPELVTLLTSSLAWAVALPAIALLAWNRARRSYEAVGI